MRADSAAFAQKNIELAKDPRYVIVQSFDSVNAVLWAFTSHSDAALPPGLTGSILGIVEGLSGTSQTLNSDTANASIGNINYNLVDRQSIVTTTLGGQLALGRSTRKERTQVYVGYQGLAWVDYTLVQTQLVTEIAFADGAYKFTCADIQRSLRTDLFVVAKTNLSLSLLAADTTVNVYDTSGFTTVAHGTSYSDAPSATVGYIKIQDEVIRYTGKTSTTFTGCVRGALNTRAVDHLVDATATQDRQPLVTEHVYLEMPAVKLIYALLTGALYNQGGATLPASWNLGIPTSYVRLADFTGIETDLWNTADDLQGFITFFQGLGKTDGKKFIETELCLLLGAFMPVYADGSLGFRRMANVLAGAAYVRQLDETNIVSYGDLVHDYGSLHNLLDIAWNWEPLQNDFTRHDVILDAGSISTYQSGDPFKLKFRGLYGSRHTLVTVKQRFDALRDRYTAPPLRLNAKVLPSLNSLEVGDVVRVKLANVRDINAPGGGGPLDRSFEIQNIQTDWVTGDLQLKLFASSQAPAPIAPTPDASVLTAAWYTGTGTALTVTGSNPGHISANVSLAGNADMNNAGAIYYYNGDLQIDAGVVVMISNNVQLRVKGFLQNNGKILGKGNGLPAGGTSGFIGTTEAGGGLVVQPPVFGTVVSNRGALVVGRNAVVPSFNLTWDGTTLSGTPGDLRGSSGSTGNQVTGRFGSSAAGGAGGAGGAGLEIICRGFAQGANGSIDLSGADGSTGANLFDSGAGATFYAGSGAGGAGGGLLMLLDGAGLTAIGLTDVAFISLNGVTPVGPGQRSAISDKVATVNYSFFTGITTGVTSFGKSRVQPVPKNPLAQLDLTIPDEIIKAEDLIAGNWTERGNPKALNLFAVVWAEQLGLYVAVGSADADAYIITSPDGVNWTERANPKANALFGLAWSGSLLVAVGQADTDAYILTSPDGVTWTERANPKAIQLISVCWGSGLFVAVGSPGATSGAYIVTSPDGITWTERANPQNFALRSVVWTGTSFVAGGATTGTQAYLITSPDGTTWTQRTNPASGVLDEIMAIVSAPRMQLSKLVAVGTNNSSRAYVIRSNDDGVTWSLISPQRNRAANLNAVTVSSGVFVAGGSSFGPSTYLLTSLDVANWRERLNPRSLDINGLAWNGHGFVAVGAADATDAYIITSLNR